MVNNTFLLLVCLLISLPLRAAEVTARLQRDSIQPDETVKLVIEIDQRWSGAGPDLAPLRRDFELLGSARGSQVNMTNGKVTSSTRWTIELAPRRSGRLRIPPLALGQQHTPALTLQVLAGGGAPGPGGASEVFLEARIEPSHPYVGQQITYTLRLFHALDLLDGSLGDPQPDAARVRRLGKDVSFSTQRGGRRYQVIERRYALFAQRAGKLLVPSVRFDGRVSAPAGGVFGGGAFGGLFTQGRRLRARSKPLTLMVRAPAAAFGGADWLPAKEVTVSDQWSTDPGALKVGEPVTRTLALLAKGVEAAQLPTLADSVPAGLKSYPDQPKLETVSDARDVTGSRIQRVALVATRAGTLTAPEIRLRWWDVARDAERTVVIPARTLHVAPAPAAAPTPRPMAPPLPELRSMTAPARPTAATGDPRLRHWQLLSAALLGAWLVTLVAWWRTHRRKREAGSGIAQPGPATTLRDARRALARACQENDPRAARAALLEWGRAAWPATPPLSLAALATRLDHQPLATAVATLNRALYAAESGAWRGVELRTAADAGLRPPESNKRSRHPGDALPGLYPER